MLRKAEHRLHSKISTLSSAPMLGVPLVELIENHRVLIENHLGVTSYGSSEISVKVSRGVIVITGEKLEILCMSRERIVICGIIAGVNFEREVKQ